MNRNRILALALLLMWAATGCNYVIGGLESADNSRQGDPPHSRILPAGGTGPGPEVREE